MEGVIGTVFAVIVMLYWIFLVFSLVVASGIYANRLNRSVFGWVVCSLLFSPIVSFGFLVALGPRHVEVCDDKDVIKENKPESDDECPQCGTQLNGVVCPSCKHWVG